MSWVIRVVFLGMIVWTIALFLQPRQTTTLGQFKRIGVLEIRYPKFIEPRSQGSQEGFGFLRAFASTLYRPYEKPHQRFEISDGHFQRDLLFALKQSLRESTGDEINLVTRKNVITSPSESRPLPDRIKSRQEEIAQLSKTHNVEAWLIIDLSLNYQTQFLYGGSGDATVNVTGDVFWVEPNGSFQRLHPNSWTSDVSSKKTVSITKGRLSENAHQVFVQTARSFFDEHFENL